MPPSFLLPVTVPTYPPPPRPASTATPATVLAEWQATATPTQRQAQAPHQPAVLALLTDLAAGPLLDINVDLEDARVVLRGAAAVRAATTTTSGSARATEALRQLLAALPASPPARHALLSILSSSPHELEMDELVEITEAVHTKLLGNEGEMIFGHGSLPGLAPGILCVRLLLAYPT